MSTSYYARYGKYILLDEETFPNTKEVSVCGNKDCQDFDKVVDGKFCNECGSKLKQVEKYFRDNAIAFLRREAIKEDIDADLIQSEYYAPKIIYSEDSVRTGSDEFELVSFNKIEKIINQDTPIFDFLIKTLEKNKIPFKLNKGFFVGVS